VHVQRRGLKVAKFWLEPVLLKRSGGFSAVEIRRIEALVSEHSTLLLGEWHEFFRQSTDRPDSTER